MIEQSTRLLDLCENTYFKLNPKIRHPNTRNQYRIALKNLGEAIGHTPTVADLTDDSVALLMHSLNERHLSERTINERRNRIHALWHWLAKRGRVSTWPTTAKMDEPQRTPLAWSAGDIRKLFTACALIRGSKNGCPKWMWWQALLMLLWDTGGRITEILSARWEHLDWETRYLHIPAELRKGRRKDMLYLLSPETVGFLRMLKRHSPDTILPVMYHSSYIWRAYEKLLDLAGLPKNRQCKFHRLRKSVASHFEAAGGDATKMLGHSSRAVTESYLDPRIAKSEHATDRLFRPTG